MEIKKDNLEQLTEKIYDGIVVGGGPGGLSAGIYLQRYLLNSLVVDKGKGRSIWMQKVTNYFGVSPDTSGHVLVREGKKRYLDLDGDFINAYAETVKDLGDYLEVSLKVGRTNSEYVKVKTKYLIAASGIIDYLPELENMRNVFDYAGYNVHVCLICDGYEMRDSNCGVFANSNSNIKIVDPLSWFTKSISVFTNASFEVDDEVKSYLKDLEIDLYEVPIKQFIGENHVMNSVELEDGKIIELDNGLISMGSQYHNNYLKDVDLTWKSENLITDENCRSSHPRIFGIGDLKVGLNQVSIAVGDGAKAATGIWREIRKTKNNK